MRGFIELGGAGDGRLLECPDQRGRGHP